GKQRALLQSYHKQLSDSQYEAENKKQRDELIARQEMEIGKILEKFNIYQKEVVVKHQEQRKKFEAKRPEGEKDEKPEEKKKSARKKREERRKDSPSSARFEKKA